MVLPLSHDTTHQGLEFVSRQRLQKFFRPTMGCTAPQPFNQFLAAFLPLEVNRPQLNTHLFLALKLYMSGVLPPWLARRHSCCTDPLWPLRDSQCGNRKLLLRVCWVLGSDLCCREILQGSIRKKTVNIV
jgi:hypothetical protein